VCSKLNGNLGEPLEDSECLEFSLFLRQTTACVSGRHSLAPASPAELFDALEETANKKEETTTINAGSRIAQNSTTKDVVFLHLSRN
jgi:hypothetical protein